jgi:hypothetical protein
MVPELVLGFEPWLSRPASLPSRLSAAVHQQGKQLRSLHDRLLGQDATNMQTCAGGCRDITCASMPGWQACTC